MFQGLALIVGIREGFGCLGAWVLGVSTGQWAEGTN